MNWKITKRLILNFLCFVPCLMYANWDFENSIPGASTNSLDVLRDKKFKYLQNRVYGKLRKSWCTREKAQLIMESIVLIAPSIYVEIGAFSGSTILPAASALKFIKHGHLFVIDAWSNDEAIKGLKNNDINTDWWSKVDMTSVKKELGKMIRDNFLQSYCTVIEAPSQIAVSQFDAIDFLHLDGNFSEEGAFQDVQIYLPKVKSGGYILLSNAFYVIANEYTKLKSLWVLLDHCDVISEIEDCDTILFRKR